MLTFDDELTSAPAPSLRWGVLGPGWIAEQFISSLHEFSEQRVVAVASRDAGRAAAFAERMHVPRSHGSYESLVADPDVDVIYVATPHPAHLGGALLAIEAGKHVVIEKPLALNGEQGRRIRDAAAARGVFCMEALWSFFLPKFDRLREVLASGRLGTVHTVIADHGEWFDVGHRILRADLAGGPMLDLATYPVALAVELLGAPVSVQALGERVPGGEVLGQASMLFGHGGGGHSIINSTVLGDTPSGATIVGTGGTIDLPVRFGEPGDFTVTFTDGSEPIVWREEAIRHRGLHHEATAVARAIGAGRTEHPFRPLAASIATLDAMDAVRAIVGDVYPGE